MNKLIISLSLASLITLGGCTTFDAYTGEKKTSNTAKGAGTGAGAALLLSYLKNRNKSSKKRNKRMLRDAGIGAIIGGGVGYYMDTQEAKLRKQLRGTGVSVQRDGNNINLIMPGNITFATNRRNLRSDFYDVLDSVVLVVKEYNKTTIVVSGHTDSVGSATYNQKLSEDRARSVADFLVNKKVNPARIELTGLGEKNPIASNKSKKGRSLNRRVEITLFPITEQPQ
ncbi:MAG: OmpA family lipoprotein [Gammaproteobacteria bacterium]|nr:MAG: OmpA family lipoprotein [Gammaproteobacteria bacterium]